MMRIAAALVLCAATICCVRGAVHPDGRERRSLDQTLPRLGDVVPGGLGILNQDYIPLIDCQAIYENGLNTSGLYYINPDGKGQFLVYCDMSQLDGVNHGWTLIQRRRDGSFDFNKSWAEYRNGFGNLKTNVWLGLDNIKRLTDTASYKLYIAVQCHDSDVTSGQSVRYAKYGTFGIGSEAMYYRLSVGVYDKSSTAGDSISVRHNGKYFSTRDRDNDNSPPNCAGQYQSGWWFSANGCVDSNLNGVWQSYGYFNSTGLPDQYGVAWKTGVAYQNTTYSFQTTVMAVRR